MTPILNLNTFFSFPQIFLLDIDPLLVHINDTSAMHPSKILVEIPLIAEATDLS